MSNIPIYNDCKNKIKTPDYIHPTLEQILKPTYGIIIYQEQVMQIAQTLAGFTAGEADILRRAMGKKKKAELDKQKERFISGAIKNGIRKDVANFVFTKIEPFAQYGFNKSHAAAYALIAYQTAFLKTYYKEDFIAATMTTELTNTSKLREFVEELKRLKIKIIRPCINQCFAEFKAEKNIIYYGLGAIKSVGFEAISNIIIEREKNGKFESLINFIERVDARDVNKLQLEGLVKSGAFDEFDTDRNKILNSIPIIIQQIKNANEDKSNNQTGLFDNIDSKKNFDYIQSNPWSKKELLYEEFKSLGFYMSDHPLNDYGEIFTQLNIISYKKFLNNNDQEAMVVGTIMSIQEKKSTKGTPFAIIKFSDNEGEFELFLFSEILISNRDKIKESESFVLTVHKDKLINKESSQLRINVRKIMNLDDIINKPYSKVTIELEKNFNIDEIKSLLGNKGETQIDLVIKDENKKIHYNLQNLRKLDFKQLKVLKNKEYVKKITV
jgi:DNA polymerase-3 subunit alpha